MASTLEVDDLEEVKIFEDDVLGDSYFELRLKAISLLNIWREYLERENSLPDFSIGELALHHFSNLYSSYHIAQILFFVQEINEDLNYPGIFDFIFDDEF